MPPDLLAGAGVGLLLVTVLNERRDHPWLLEVLIGVAATLLLMRAL